MSYYKPRAELELRVPPWGAKGDVAQDIVFKPRVISLKWTKNHHLAADELTVTIHYSEGGIDPRMIKHAVCRMWLWDEMQGPMDEHAHLRFVGICKKPSRKLTDNGFVVEMSFLDYTTFFLMMKPFPSQGMPEWTDTLPQVWAKICDNTGYRDRGAGAIKSNVTALKTRLFFDPPSLATRTLGEMVPGRFHRISKPSPKNRTDAWAVWQWCCEALGLVSQIDRDRCIVTTYSEFIRPDKAAHLIYGENIKDFEESADTHVAMKGILGKSFNTLTGTLLESAYPPPDDPFIKKSRAAVKRIAKGKNDPLNETSADYEEFNFHELQTQDALDARVREAWEEMSRQEMKGKITTSEMRLVSNDGEELDIMALGAGDCIHVGIGEHASEILSSGMTNAEAIDFLMSRCGYIRPVAELVMRNIGARAFRFPIFHVETIAVEYGWGKFNVEIAYHNKINLDGIYGGSKDQDETVEGITGMVYA